jgi:hypothetical protein
MIDSFEDAAEEFKRAEHLFYVSLKYTRTVDVIRGLIERLISTYDFALMCLMKYAKEQKKISEIPSSPILQCQKAEEIFTDLKIQKYLDLYVILRKLMRAPYTKKEEYRRHVAMLSDVDGKTMEINIDLLTEYFNKTLDLMKLVQSLIKPKK